MSIDVYKGVNTYIKPNIVICVRKNEYGKEFQ